MDFFCFNNRWVIAVKHCLEKCISSGTLATLPLPPSLQTFFRYFYNALDTFALKIKFLA